MRPRALLPLLRVLTAWSGELGDRTTQGVDAQASRVRRVSEGIVNGTPDTAANDAVVRINVGTIYTDTISHAQVITAAAVAAGHPL